MSIFIFDIFPSVSIIMVLKCLSNILGQIQWNIDVSDD